MFTAVFAADQTVFATHCDEYAPLWIFSLCQPDRVFVGVQAQPELGRVRAVGDAARVQPGRLDPAPGAPLEDVGGSRRTRPREGQV